MIGRILVRSILTLVLPLILHSQGPREILVFLTMNSIINLLMTYTKIQMRAMTRLASKVHLLDQGVSEAEIFESMKEAIKKDENKVEIPKLISYTANLSMLISLGALVIGMGKLLGKIG